MEHIYSEGRLSDARAEIMKTELFHQLSRLSSVV